MEFHFKLQELRKSKGITQEELAEVLFVSRTAVSKWESGRGYPNIDSLKAIARFFSITIDELLSGDELLTIAEEDQKQTEKRFRDIVFGLLDCCVSMLLFLPFFRQYFDGKIQETSLLVLHNAELYIRVGYYSIVISLFLFGILTLALQNYNNSMWIKNKAKVSFILNVLGTVLFIISMQPYAAIYMLMFLVIKILMLIKW